MINAINLATEEKQDQILSNFPISSGTDFASYSPFISCISTAYSRPSVLLTVTGSGILTCIQMLNYSLTAVKITIDGTNIAPQNISFSAGSSTSVFIPFSTSLKIEGHSPNAGSGIAQFYYLLE